MSKIKKELKEIIKDYKKVKSRFKWPSSRLLLEFLDKMVEVVEKSDETE